MPRRLVPQVADAASRWARLANEAADERDDERTRVAVTVVMALPNLLLHSLNGLNLRKTEREVRRRLQLLNDGDIHSLVDELVRKRDAFKARMAKSQRQAQSAAQEMERAKK